MMLIKIMYKIYSWLRENWKNRKISKNENKEIYSIKKLIIIILREESIVGIIENCLKMIFE